MISFSIVFINEEESNRVKVCFYNELKKKDVNRIKEALFKNDSLNNWDVIPDTGEIPDIYEKRKVFYVKGKENSKIFVFIVEDNIDEKYITNVQKRVYSDELLDIEEFCNENLSFEFPKRKLNLAFFFSSLVVGIIIIIFFYGLATHFKFDIFSEKSEETSISVPTLTPTVDYAKIKWDKTIKILKNVVKSIKKDSLTNKENNAGFIIEAFLDLFYKDKWKIYISPYLKEDIFNTIFKNVADDRELPYSKVCIYMYFERLLDMGDIIGFSYVEEKSFKEKLKDLDNGMRSLIKLLNNNIEEINKEIKRKIEEAKKDKIFWYRNSYLLRSISPDSYSIEDEIRALVEFLDPVNLYEKSVDWIREMPNNETYGKWKKFFEKQKEHIEESRKFYL